MNLRPFLLAVLVIVLLTVVSNYQNYGKLHEGFKDPLCKVFREDRHVNRYAAGCRYPGNTGCLSAPTYSKKTTNKLQRIFSSCAHCSPGNNCYYGSYVGNRAPHKKPLKYRCAYCKNRRYCSWE